jgi:vacuolar-type H+-ATPase subunit B/Vma2
VAVVAQIWTVVAQICSRGGTAAVPAVDTPAVPAVDMPADTILHIVPRSKLTGAEK